MADKITLTTLVSMSNEAAFIAAVNQNFEDLADKVDTLVSRDGDSPNHMLANLDMNSKRLINLPAPISDSEPLRAGDVIEGNIVLYVGDAEAAAVAAEAAQTAAETAQGLAETAQTAAEAAQAAAEQAALDAANIMYPTGIVHHHIGLTPPTGWVVRDGGTIGSVASGATNRAHADTLDLFSLIWDTMPNSGDFVIQDSTGTPTTRGASAAADFAANKRMPLPDDTNNFDRGGTGAQIGVYTADSFASHTHEYLNGSKLADFGSQDITVGDPGTGTTNTGATGGSETAPKHRRYLPIIKL